MKRLLIILCFISVVSNFLVFNSNINQKLLLEDARKDNFFVNETTLNNINYDYPNLSINSVPILTYLSRYDTNKGDFKSAIEKISISLKHNPYSLYSKYLLSRNYIYINDFKNSETILESLYNFSPKIESSTSLYFFILGENKNISKLIEHREMLANIDNYNIWSFYIDAIKKNISDKVDTIFYDSLVDDFENKF